MNTGRALKKQIVCFIPAEDNQKYYQYALSKNMTRQDLLATAINKALEAENTTLRLEVNRRKMSYMPPRVRKIRVDDYGRTGKTALAGWYAKSDVRKIMDYALQKNSCLQDIAVYGLMLMEEEMK